MACEDIKTRLDEANAALHRLLTGAQVVIIVDAFRTRVEYERSDVDKLTQYIAVLQVEYDQCIRGSGNRVVLTRPVQFIF